MKKRILDNKGFMSIYTIMWCAVLLPFLLFVTIDLTFWYNQNVRLKSITDNAGASAVTKLQQNKIPQGILNIDNNEAEKTVKDIIKKDLLLNDDLTPKEGSSLVEKPVLKITIVNEIEAQGTDVNTERGKVKVRHPSVVVDAQYKVRGLFYYKFAITLKKVGVSQVQFRR